MILVDASDSIDEAQRKLDTTRREVLDRQRNEDQPLVEAPPPQVVLTKVDAIDAVQEQHMVAMVSEMGFANPIAISSVEDHGIDALQRLIRERLFGAPCSVYIRPPTGEDHTASARIAADVYEHGMVEEDDRTESGEVRMQVWIAPAARAQLQARWKRRIDMK